MIRLRLLGTAELRCESGTSESLVVMQPKRLALLAYLSVRPRVVHRRDTLLGLFWPDLDGEHARGALNKALHHVRRSLGNSVLLSHGDDGLQINVEVLHCDADAFDRAVDAGQWDEALAYYGGDLLPGFFLSGAPEFEHWLDQERERLRRRAKGAAWKLADVAAAAGNGAGASDWARRAHALDPEDEAGLRRVLAVLEQAGDRAGALRLYDEFATRLQQEYVLQPSSETAELVARIRRRRSDPDSVPTIQPIDSVVVEPADGPASLPRSEEMQVDVRAAAPYAARGTAVRGHWGGIKAAAAVVIVALATAGYVLLPKAAAAPASGLEGGREQLLLAEFDAHGADPALARALTVATRAALEQSETIALISDAAAAQTLDQMQHGGTLALDAAREVAVRSGVRAVVHGGVTAVGGRFVLTLRLVEAESGNSLVTLASHAPGSVELLPAIDELTRELRTRIGESLRHVRAALPLQQVTTRSFDALQKYSAAYRAHYAERDFPKAVQLLQEAVALDSGFAMAWRQLAVSAGSAGMATVRQSAIEAAFRFRERASPRERDVILSTYYQATGDRARAAGAYEAMLLRNATNVEALHALANIYASRRNAVAAESLYKRVISLDPGHVVAHSNLVLNLWMQERFQEAERVLRAARERFPGDPVLAMRDADLHWFRGDLDRYEQALDRLRHERAEARRYAIRTRADLALMRGRLREYRELRTEARQNDLLFGFETPERDSLFEARVHAELRGQRERATQMIDAALRDYQISASEPPPLGPVVVAWVAAHEPEKARLVLQQHVTRADTAQLRREQQSLEQARAWIAMGEGRHREAAAHFRRADSAPDGPVSECGTCLPVHLALAYDAMGWGDSAIVMYERSLRPSLHGRGFSNAFYRAHVLERLGLLYEASGKHDRAVTYNARFIDLWKDADVELQPRVTAARQRNARLLARNGRRG
jgi:DNA-binding SARP family transcriptional activator/tetratricopeptide (TPR) repeat protein